MHLENGIYQIDTGFQRPNFDAAYLVVENGRGAFIDCATNHSIDNLLRTLDEAGLSVDAVDWVILTHIHLDHAGGAGKLLSSLPQAKLVVHPRGARHMIDPSKLWASATSVYGEEEMERSYGKLVPVAAERIIEAPDGYVVDLAGRTLQCLDTPGHAKHHNAIVDSKTGWIFSGDIFGLSYREFDNQGEPCIFPTTSPVQFDPEAMHQSIDRLVALHPPAICLTHFGPVYPIERLARDLHQIVDKMVSLALQHADDTERHNVLKNALLTLYQQHIQAHNPAIGAKNIVDLIGMDVELNTQGLEVWLTKRRK